MNISMLAPTTNRKPVALFEPPQIKWTLNYHINWFLNLACKSSKGVIASYNVRLLWVCRQWVSSEHTSDNFFTTNNEKQSLKQISSIFICIVECAYDEGCLNEPLAMYHPSNASFVCFIFVVSILDNAYFFIFHALSHNNRTLYASRLVYKILLSKEKTNTHQNVMIKWIFEK